MSERTYTRETFLRAKASWDDFGSEWWEMRRLAADRGILFAPTGTKHDDRDAENPSQRAVIYRALIDQPTELRRIIRQSSSWYQVVDRIIGLETRLRADYEDAERDVAADRADRPTHKQAVMTIAEIFDRIEGSR